MIKRTFLIGAIFFSCATVYAVDQGYTNFKSSINVNGLTTGTTVHVSGEISFGDGTVMRSTSGFSGGGSGGQSVAVKYNGIVVSSPTTTLNLVSPMIATLVGGSTAQITVDTTTANGLLINSSATATYLTKSSATSTYFPLISSTTLLTLSSATATYLQSAVANSTYLSKSSASATYFQPANATTTNLPEGTNQYFTTARATSAISASAPITYSNGVIGADASILSTTTAASTYLTQSSATTTYFPLISSTTLLTTSSATATYLQQAVASSTYLTKSSATTTYFQPANATTSNLPEGSNLYFTTARSTTAVSASAPLTYSNGVFGVDGTSVTLQGQNVLSFSSATATYLQKLDAASTYLTQSNAASTYLTQSSATATYLNKASAYISSANTTSALTVTPNGTSNATPTFGVNFSSVVSQSDLASYVSQSSATTNLLSQSSATATYFNKNSVYVSSINVSAALSVTGNGTSGSVPTVSVNSSSGTLQGNAFNSANQLVQLNGSTQLPAVSGVNLTNLNASNLASGTVPNAQIDGSSITKGGQLVAGSNITLTPSGGQTTIAATSSGSGYTVQPATVTFQLTQGILASTIAFSGPVYPVVQQQVSNGAGLCQINNGCIPSGQFETTNSSQDYTAVIFQAGTTEYWQWGMRLPLNFVTTSTFTIKITQTSTATATASWKADMICIGNGASIDQAWGTAVSFSTTSTNGAFLVSQESPAITPAGSCSNGAWAKLRVYRNGDPVSDVYMTQVDVYYEKNNISEH